MNPDWSILRRELRALRRAGTGLPLWWRDDDAVAPTDALDRLHGLSRALGLPVHLAVIPALAEPALAAHVRETTGLRPMIHGWRHADHAPVGFKKAEFGQPRPAAADELQQAIARARSLFGADLLPVFVPPWNRIDPGHAGRLAGLGYRGLSTFGPRQKAPDRLVQINTHIDPIDWHGTRGLVDPEALIAHTADVLAARRRGESDTTEPLGYLTHHLVHDDAIWDFSRDLLAELLDGGADPIDLSHLLEAT